MSRQRWVIPLGFLTLDLSDAEEVSRKLAAERVLTDSRGPHLRLGPSPSLSDAQLRVAARSISQFIAGR